MRQKILPALCLLSLLVMVPVALGGAEETAAPDPATVEPAPAAPACPGMSCGGGCGMGRGHRGGMAAAESPEPTRCCKGCGGHGGNGPASAGMMNDEDHQGFFFLLDHRDKIRREVKAIEKGVETLTESDDPEVAEGIRKHVAAMYDRIQEGRPIHARDPLFAEIFRNADRIRIESEPTEKGIRVREVSDDPEVAELIQAHAEVVNQFIANGHAEMHRNHPVP
ncbi:MAG: hypothetical protein PVF68_17615 [Acidobacteriota bacterium]|jgi:hypothetical protein